MKDIDYWRKRLKYFRESIGLTQEELSEKANISQSQINHLETGRRLFTQKTLESIMDAMSITYNDLFSFDLSNMKDDDRPIVADVMEILTSDNQAAIDMLKAAIEICKQAARNETENKSLRGFSGGIAPGVPLTTIESPRRSNEKR